MKNTVVPLAGDAQSYFGEAWGASSLKTKQINIHGPTVYRPLDKQFPRSLDIHEDKGKGEQGLAHLLVLLINRTTNSLVESIWDCAQTMSRF